MSGILLSKIARKNVSKSYILVMSSQSFLSFVSTKFVTKISFILGNKTIGFPKYSYVSTLNGMNLLLDDLISDPVASCFLDSQKRLRVVVADNLLVFAQLDRYECGLQDQHSANHQP